MNRNSIVVVALAAMIAAGAWYHFSGAGSGAAQGPAAGRPAGLREVPVMIAHPKLKEFAQEVEALGTVRAKESVDITAKVADRVAAIHFEEGKQVKKGDVLVELDNEEARADLAAAEAAERDSRSLYKRSQELFQTKALSEAQLDQLEATMLANQARVAAARSRVNDRVIRAPFGGRVGLRNVSLGSLVSPGGVITTLDDLSTVKLDFAVPELFLSSLQPGLTVEARSSAYPNTVFKGRVDSIDTRVDPTTRAIVVRALADNRDARLRPGMFMTLQLVRKAGKALMLPESAIVPEDSKHFVFVVADGRALKREIVIGRRRPGEVEILEGATEADVVVIDGTLNLHDGTAVAARNDLAAQAKS
ncbi:efflux RND transporter periplasmic adaptor subunit [Steroidobacter sp.]|uniref:efflux RND transporter periplasmic adaptor subunit n=1 Tax=Steroidobacter sp. TaxID=1978227 RepID=UPI001A4690F1|nr:efflux RND transporter periplasmic adaptor subunit [Steroidobacter sp.]MBL8269695.1 efflux RND transporter periplasmic adaptor subunit [Steroidobacter sp.]